MVNLKEYEQAILSYDKAVEINPKLSETYANIKNAIKNMFTLNNNNNNNSLIKLCN